MRACGFIGHRDCPKEIENNLFNVLKRLIIEEKVYTFYVGTHGAFDKLVYKVLHELKKEYELQIVVVLAYIYNKTLNDYYDFKEAVFPDELTTTPPRFAIKKRNTYILNRSDYMVTYLNTRFSNTYDLIEEAVKKKKQIINLGEFDIKRISL